MRHLQLRSKIVLQEVYSTTKVKELLYLLYFRVCFSLYTDVYGFGDLGHAVYLCGLVEQLGVVDFFEEGGVYGCG